MPFVSKYQLTELIDESLNDMPNCLFDIGGAKICREWSDEYTKQFVLKQLDYVTKIKVMEQIIARLYNMLYNELKKSKGNEVSSSSE